MNSTNPKPSALHSTASYSSLASTLKPDPDPQTTAQQGTQATSRQGPQEYIYWERSKKPPNPDAQLKEKSKLDKFLTKFQSPMVQKANAARERTKLEEERTGVKKYSSTGAPQSSWQSATAFGAVGRP